jgi:hypothetical protein
MALTIGDASGKGLAAALMIANVQSSLRIAALFTGNDVAALLNAVNRQVHASAPRRSVRYIILWRVRRKDADARVRERWSSPADGPPTRGLNHLS